MKPFTSALALVALFTTACATSYDVYDVKKAQASKLLPPRNLIYYALPRNPVRVTIPVEVTTVEAPQCTDDDFMKALRLKPAKGGFKIGDVTLATRAEPDPDAIYAIDMPARALHKFTSTIDLSDAGLLNGAQASDQNQALEFGAGIVKIAAGVAGKVIAFGAANRQPPPPNTPPDELKCLGEQKQIKDLQSDRGKLITGASATVNPPTSETLKLMLDSVDAQLEGLLALFTGEVTKTSASVVCDVLPSPAVTSLSLVQFSTEGKLVMKDPGCIASPKIALDANAAIQYDLRLAAKADPQQFAALIKIGMQDPGAVSGLFYRVPASVSLQVLNRQKVLADGSFLLAQFGTVNSLPRGADAHTFQSVVNATLYPATGALQKLELNATPRDTTAIAALGDAAGTVLDAEKAKRDAAAAAKDELTVLERERKILEEKKKIQDLQKELTPPTTP